MKIEAAATVTPASGARNTSPSLRTLQWVALVFVGLKIWFMLGAPPSDDETYYWLWGQNPGLSYLDHPPLQAWLLAISGQIWGWNLFALRFPAFLTSALTGWLLWIWAGRLMPSDRVRAFWLALVIYLTSPMLFLYSSTALHDHLMVAMLLLSLNFFGLHFAGGTRDSRGTLYLYLAGVFLGLAVLSKYYALFAGIGVAAFVLLSPNRTAHLRNIHLWLSAALAMAIQTPVIYWNAAQGSASYRFHLLDRFDLAWPPEIHPEMALTFVVVSALTLSPFMLVALLRTFKLSPEGQLPNAALRLARTVFITVSLVSLVMSAFVPISDYWNLVAYAGLLPFVILVPFGARIIWAHVVYGAAAVGLLLCLHVVAPVNPLIGAKELPRTYFGWDQVGARIDELATENGVQNLMANTYREASKLGFAMQRDDISPIDKRRDQFDYWIDDDARQAESALIVIMDDHGAARMRRLFDRIEHLSSLEVTHAGAHLANYDIYLGTGYRGQLP